MKRLARKQLKRITLYAGLIQFGLAFVIAFYIEDQLVYWYVFISCLVLVLQLIAPTLQYNRQAKLKRNGGKHTDQEWLALQARCGFRCAHCKQLAPLTKDHIIPISRGGVDAIWNIQPLCQSCNSKKGNRI